MNIKKTISCILKIIGYIVIFSLEVYANVLMIVFFFISTGLSDQAVFGNIIYFSCVILAFLTGVIIDVLIWKETIRIIARNTLRICSALTFFNFFASILCAALAVLSQEKVVKMLFCFAIEGGFILFVSGIAFTIGSFLCAIIIKICKTVKVK